VPKNPTTRKPNPTERSRNPPNQTEPTKQPKNNRKQRATEPSRQPKGSATTETNHKKGGDRGGMGPTRVGLVCPGVSNGVGTTRAMPYYDLRTERPHTRTPTMERRRSGRHNYSLASARSTTAFVAFTVGAKTAWRHSHDARGTYPYSRNEANLTGPHSRNAASAIPRDWEGH
jgi:hypothetical protein